MRPGEDKTNDIKPKDSNKDLNWKNATMVTSLKESIKRAARFIHYK